MQKPLKNIYCILLGISIFAAGIATIFLYQKMDPCILTDLENRGKRTENFIYFFRDLDKDGYSESFIIENNPIEKYYNLKIYHYRSGKPLLNNQYNFREPLVISGINYRDINQDGVEEIFIFSNTNKKLYLYVIDFAQADFLIRRRFILSGPKNNPHPKWDVQNINSVFLDIDNDNEIELIFTINSGYSKRPRGIFAFDITEKKILKEFRYNAGISNIFTSDITGDGKKEIIVSTDATDNFRSKENYSDQKAWLLVFNYELKLVFPGKPLGKKFSGLQSFPFSVNGSNLIFSQLRGGGEPNKIFLINGGGNILKEIELPAIADNFIIDYNKNNNQKILINFGIKQQVHIYDSNFNLVNKFSNNNSNRLNIIYYKDIDNDSVKEFLCCDIDGFYVKDQRFNNIASFSWNKEGPNKVTFKQNGPGTTPQIAINTNKSFFLLNYKPNPFYPYLALIFPALIILLYSVLLFLHLVINKIKIYLSYFLFSLKQSDNAILLLNHKGNILSLNHNAASILRLTQNLKSGQHYKAALHKRYEICQAIEECQLYAKQVKKEVSFEEAQSSFIGQVTVTPFISYLKFVQAYLVEIKDSTQQVLTDRQSNWQRAIRKMVHDIKNPLAGVQLKLQTIFYKLNDEYPDIVDSLKEEIETAYSEIKRIRNISKDFLKFNDLEILQPQKLQVCELLKQCLGHFKAFQNDYMIMEIDCNNKLSDKVYWDKRQIEILMHILIENAIDAVKGKGEILLSANLAQRLPDMKEEYVKIQVTDNGPGIPEDSRDKIFKPHFSTKTEGSGMGLVFARHIVQQHRGSIDFSTLQGSGTTFIITLPLNILNLKTGY